MSEHQFISIIDTGQTEYQTEAYPGKYLIWWQIYQQHYIISYCTCIYFLYYSIYYHPVLEWLDRLQKWPTLELSVIVYRHIADHFK